MVTHDSAEGKFETPTESGTAYVHYARTPAGIDITYTFVPPPERGRGLGARLVRYVVEWAREEGLAVTATCGFAARVLAARR